MNYNLLKIFIKVAEFGSFTKAAKQLNQPKSRISRSISRLEEDLKTELIKRSTRSVNLTEAGKNLYQETQGLIHQLEKKVESIAHKSDEISGTLSISAPLDFGENVMPNLICEFTEIYPQINFRILLSDSYLDLMANDIDLALRVGRLKDSALKQKKITDTQLILVASKEYIDLKGRPKSWDEVSGYDLLSFWNENHQDPLEKMYKKYSLSPTIRANSFPMLKQLALASKGIALLPDTLCQREMNNRELIRILPTWGHTKSPLQIVFSGSRNLPKKTRAFIDFLTEKKDLFSS